MVIFIVEDNPLYQQLIKKELQSVSAATHLFTTGEDCIKELVVHNPDVIVLDNDLDGVLTGLETLKIIRISHPDLYVLIFSARQELDTVENFIDYGHFDYLEKTSRAFIDLKKKICASEAYMDNRHHK